jgi:hypothetical protein
VDHHDSSQRARAAAGLAFSWLKVSAHRAIDRDVLDAMPPGVVDLSISTDDSLRLALNSTVLSVKAKVLKYDLPGHEVKDQHTVSFDVPDSPWQHWKRKHGQAWWLRWFVQRWPVRTEQLSRTVHFTAIWEDMATYPWQTVAPTARELGQAVRLVDLKLKREER